MSEENFTGYCECVDCTAVHVKGVNVGRSDFISIAIAQIATNAMDIERLKQAEESLLDAIADWYYLTPNPQADKTLAEQYENFLTFGQGGANFSEAQDLAEGEKRCVKK